jgi:hypothetical protein
VRFLPYAAGPTNGHALLHVTRQPGCSSLLPPDRSRGPVSLRSPV